MIHNADLLGFDQLEITIISLIALYHRGSLTSKKDPELAALTPELQRTVIEASTLLRCRKASTVTRRVPCARLVCNRRPAGLCSN